MTDDIVARLRAVLNHDPIVELLAREAADVIERLRKGGCARDQRTTQFCAESVELQKEIEQLRSDVLGMSEMLECVHQQLDHITCDRNNLELIVDKLTAERDAARQLISKYALDVLSRIDEEIQGGS